MSQCYPAAESAALDGCPIEDTRNKSSRHFDPHREPFDPNRKGMMLPLPGILECTAVYPGQKTHAPSPCWRDSTTKPVKWQHMTKDTARQLYQQAEDFERQTRQPGKQDGDSGATGWPCCAP